MLGRFVRGPIRTMMMEVASVGCELEPDAGHGVIADHGGVIVHNWRNCGARDELRGSTGAGAQYGETRRGVSRSVRQVRSL